MRTSARKTRLLLQLRVFDFGLLQDEDVGSGTCGSPIRQVGEARVGAQPLPERVE